MSTIFGDSRYGLSLPSRRTLQEQWFGNVRADLLAGVVVALALIPEAIAFSIIAGVDPKVGLYASFSIAVITAFVGGRPAMISAATGAMALVMITLVRDHGLQYLFAATILTGAIQVLFGVFKLGRYMKFVPRPVMTGFVNALAILIFMAQLPLFVGTGPLMYAVVAGGLAIIYGLPYLTKAVPSPLIAIVGLTILAVASGGGGLSTVGDMGELPTTLPFFSIPSVPLNMETLSIIFPVAMALALVGLIESLLTASIVDEMTDTPSDKNKESRGQGIANVITGFFGGMAGCAMIGQSVINVKSGGRGRLSTFAAGAFLLFFILVLSDWLVLIPMGALVAVMFMVSFSTFDWSSLRVDKVPFSETLVMGVTVGVVVGTHNLALGVLVGILLSAMLFARQVAHLAFMEDQLSEDGRTQTVAVVGNLFFATVTGFLDHFDFTADVDKVILDLSQAHVWDASAVAAIDKAVLRYRARGVEMEIVGLNEPSAAIVERVAVHDKPGMALAGH
ncbi:SulP family inorganic anion transporter [Rubricoccus marinus]|uniref:SulP family inorganic anion transporter n=1 Tax=Rubricoccus marinus TaxID=716817 RepID=UPI003183BAB9